MSPPSKNSELRSRPHLASLTGLRFFAALHVVLFHAWDWAHRDGGILRALASTGYVAVSLFFVLSGFILAYTYGPRPIVARQFYIARFARVYPVYVVGLLLAAPFYVREELRQGHLGTMLGQMASVGLLLQAHVPSWALSWNPPAWSLSVEAFFYASFPWLGAKLLRTTPTRSRIASLVGWGASMALVFVYLTVTRSSPDYATPGFWLEAMRYAPIVRLPEFVFGIVLGAEFSRGTRLPARSAPFLLLLTLVVLVASARAPYLYVHNGLLVPLFGALILSLAGDEGITTRVLGGKALVMLGEASYSLYILHVPLLMASGAVARAVAPELGGTSIFTILYLVVAVTMSVATYRLVEVPARRRLRRLGETVASRRRDPEAGHAVLRAGAPASVIESGSD